MKHRIIFTCICCILASCLSSENRIEFIHEFASDPNDQAFFEIPLDWNTEAEFPLFHQIKQFLKEQRLEIRTTDLQNYQITPKKKSKNYLIKCKHWFGINRPISEKLSKEVRAFVFWNIPPYIKKLDLSELPKEKLVLFMWESPAVEPHLYQRRYQKFFSKIYTWDDDLVDNKKFFKLFYPVLNPMDKNIPKFENKKLCTMLMAKNQSKHPDQLYTEREQAIAFFEHVHDGDFEFFGKGWESQGYKTFRGYAHDKIEVLKNYRFSICYENMAGKGYISEKIFDSFAAGNIPIYLGATNIEEYIPKHCFIDRRDFSSYEELYDFMKHMSKKEYEAYLKNIEHFLRSDAAQLFSRKNFIRTFQEAVSSNS
ncbi:MAG TPA: glycosyltransferase family 10 [Rhabdochlamydiaceae bacterium]|nr:glycosyltransferase family 10 [Rhabdochlamydiaceae bacterium]